MAIDRVALRTEMQAINTLVKDIPNDGNNATLKRLLMVNSRTYIMKMQLVDQLVGESEHATVLADADSMVTHINSYRTLLGLDLI